MISSKLFLSSLFVFECYFGIDLSLKAQESTKLSQTKDSTFNKILEQPQNYIIVSSDGKQYPATRLSELRTFMTHYNNGAVIYHKITEISLNGKFLRFRSNKIDPKNIIYNNSTTDFYLRAGDVVTFFRNTEWFNEKGGGVNANNYQSFHDLSWSVEVCDAKNRERVFLIDTIHIKKQEQPNYPKFVGKFPYVDIVKFTTPSNFEGKDVFIRLKGYVSNRTENFKVSVVFKTLINRSIDYSVNELNDFEAKKRLAQVYSMAPINKPDKEDILTIIDNPNNYGVKFSINNELLNKDPASYVNLQAYLFNSEGELLKDWQNINVNILHDLKIENTGSYQLTIFSGNQILANKTIQVIK